ncbi:MAG TPA: hypothetical protein PLH43_10870 [Acetivibrio sp.]|uniref:hypothetical protein n=1 Tax=Acetivibrio sp. TaxID=1872092 RepID=UPI002B88F232|nr:hypothetical protein [Acetivibrio sp.]HOM03315.1 hypothetical protein [Acetivibrio sp.]
MKDEKDKKIKFIEFALKTELPEKEFSTEETSLKIISSAAIKRKFRDYVMMKCN